MSKVDPDSLHFYLILPNIFGFKGGEQVYGAFLLRALQQLYPRAMYDVFLKYDKLSQVQPHFLPHTRFHCFGSVPSRLLQSIFMAARLFWLGIWHRPTLIISGHVNYSVVCFGLKYLAGIPYWVNAHGLEIWELHGSLRQLALGNASRVVAVSQYTRNRLLKAQNLAPEQVVVLPNTFLAQRFRPGEKPSYLLERYGLKNEQPIVMTVGRLASYKGYRQLLLALAKIRSHLPHVHYIMAGKGDSSQIVALSEELDLQDSVTLAGFVADEELCDHYNLCDVFAMPSQGEGFGIVYLEAMACGKPVLAGNRDGAADPLNEGQLGCLVDPENVDAIAQTLMQMLRGQHPNRLLYQPEMLRQKAIEAYEFSRFQAILAQFLKQGLADQRQ